jgi:large subunit ribosomal protein L7/L12
MTDLTQLVNDLSNMTLLEASQLAKLLREKWGITETVSPLMQGPNRVV